MIKITCSGAATLLVLASCASPEKQSTPMVALEPAVQTAVPEIIEAPAIRTVEIAISGMR